MFATGIENSYRTVAQADGSTLRVDEMAKTDHYSRWREDFELVVEMGVAFLRYGPPYYATHLDPDRYDWSLVGALSSRGAKRRGIWCAKPMTGYRYRMLDPSLRSG